MVTLGHVGGSANWVELVSPAAALLVAARLRRRGGRKLAWVSFAALVSVVFTPVRGWAEASVTGHMVQHLVILLVAAPAMGVALSVGVPRYSRAFRRLLARVVWSHHGPLLAGIAHATVLVVWHLPMVYDAALGSSLLHSFEHATMFGTGAWWWASLTHHSRRRSLGPVVVSVFGVSVVGAVVGTMLMFSSRVVYAHGDVLDQQMAGALMAGLMGAFLTLAASGATVAHLGSARPVSSGARASRLGAHCAIAGAGVIAAMSLASPAAAADGERPDLEAGAAIYLHDCSSCHGPAGEGSRRGPSLTGAGEASNFYYLHTGRMPIASARAPVERSAVSYDDRQLADLVAYAASLGDGPALPRPSGRDAEVTAGGIHYRLHCSSCHGATGAGGALAVDEYAPSVLPASGDDVMAAVVSGPGTMPSFEGVLDEDAVADVAAYVAHLQDPLSRGLSLPGGRVGEGLGAAVAVALLLVFARLVGERS
ncbi:hypothetical protein BH23ACT5_BH23ACT5_08180 [soil metagenome]